MLVRLMLALSLLLLFPTSAFAYSYGDPNKEDVAETYKEIAAKLEKSPEDWNGAYQAFLSRKKEISQHFGEQPAKLLETNFAQKNKQLVLHNYKAVLVLNIDRRLDYAEKEFEDYAQSKLLLAKARGTLDVLAPYVSDSASKSSYAAFDKALKALGNPGLFGVGTVPSDKNEFLKQTGAIRSTLKPFFQLKAGSSETTAAAPGKTTKPQGQASKPAPQPTKPATAAPQPTPVPKAAAPQQTSASQPATTTQETAGSTPTASVPAGQTSTGTTESPAATTGNDTATSAESVSAPQEPSASQSASSAQPTQEPPAPSNVNPVVTVTVIGGLAVFIGAAFWFAKRKGLI